MKRYLTAAALCLLAIAQIPKPSGIGGGSSSSGMVLRETQTASASSALTFTACIDGTTYNEYEFRFEAIAPATDNVDLRMQVSTDGGSTWQGGTQYVNARNRYNSGGNAQSGESSAHFSLIANIDTATAARSVTGLLHYGGISNADYDGVIGHFTYAHNGGTVDGLVFNGYFESVSTINAARFLMSSGNITSGTIRCYGIAKS